MKNILLLLVLAFCFSPKNNLFAQCNPDVEAPTALCVSGVLVSLSPNGTVEFWASDLNANSFDNCPGPLSFRLEKGATPSSEPPVTQSQIFDATELGPNDVQFWAVDQAGNGSACASVIEIVCSSSPNLACDALTQVSIAPGETESLFPDDILEGGPYCAPAGHSFKLVLDPPSTPEDSLILDEDDLGSHVVQVGLYDASGNLGNSCWGNLNVVSCDVSEAPVAVCDAEWSVTVNAGETLSVNAVSFDDGSWDSCTSPEDLIFKVEKGLPPSASAPTSEIISFDENDEGQAFAVLWVGDEDGNWNTCVVEVEVSVLDCDNDTEAPTPYCINGLVINLMTGTSEVEVWAIDFDEDSFDDCTAPGDLTFRIENTGTPSANPPSTPSVLLGEGLQPVVIWVGDEAGNWDFCQTTVEVLPCSPLVSLTCNQYVQVSLSPGEPMDFLPDFMLEGNIDCLAPGDYFAMQLDPPATPVPVIELTAGDAGEHIVSVGLYNVDDNLISECWGTINVWAWSAIFGQVFADTTADCMNDNEPVLSGQPVQGIGQVTGTVYETSTDATGLYTLQVDAADTSVVISLPIGFNYGGSCPTTYSVNFPTGNTGVEIVDIPVQLNAYCPLLSVDIGTDLLRRCFDNTYYVNYCNLSAEVIDDVSIEVTLDEFMNVSTTSIPGVAVDDVTWSFEIGTLAPGECGQFHINFLLDCEATLGLTHCVEAHIMPDTLCPQVPTFTGANIEVGGYCENDTIYLEITNTGTAAMAVPLDYIVVEDVIMLQGGDFILGAGETMSIDPIFSSGSTYRLEAEQEVNHPFGGVAAIAIEGCGQAFIPGMVNFFPMDTPNPFVAVDCQENIGAYDPNDKQAFPRGYGEEHYIEKNTDIEYLIRFQNTGTDTAFNVVILDTLSQFLDATSIRPGASSHHYNFELLEEHIVRFTFPNIMLPDSNVNVALSQGFVKFRASQIQDLDLETVIENSAAIYFDFNEPVVTNTVFHTIGENFIEVVNDANERLGGFGRLHVFPNPSHGFVTFELPAEISGEVFFQLHDQLGRTILLEQFTGKSYRFNGEGMMPGVYFYSVQLPELGNYTGKIVFH